jgi:hypothetical protein
MLADPEPVNSSADPQTHGSSISVSNQIFSRFYEEKLEENDLL